MAESCVYCGNPANSTEHIIAARFLDVLARDPRGLVLPTRLTQWYGNEASPEFTLRNILGKKRKRKGSGKPPQHTIEFTTRVCTTCNNEWMDQIDDAAFSRLALMMGGETTLLSAADQAAIAAWITKVAVTARFASIKPDHVEKRWTDWLYEHHSALPDWHVWIGRYVGAHSFWYHGGDIRIQPVGPPGDTVFDEHGVLATLILGYFTVQIFGVDGQWLPEESPSQPIVKVWPPRLSGLGVALAAAQWGHH